MSGMVKRFWKGLITTFQASILVLFMFGVYTDVHAQIGLYDLVTEYQTTPIGIDEAQPRFSWKMTADKGIRGVYQTAYQISVEN